MAAAAAKQKTGRRAPVAQQLPLGTSSFPFARSICVRVSWFSIGQPHFLLCVHIFFCALLQHMFRRFLDGALQALYANTVASAICLWENCSEPRWSCAKQRTAKKKLTNIAALLPHGKGFLCDYAMLKHEYLVLACNFCKKQTKISNVCLSGISMVVWLHFTQPQCVQCHLDSGAAFVNEHSDTQRGCWAVECFVRVL